MEIKKMKDLIKKIENIKHEEISNQDKTELICENEFNKIKIFCISKRYEECNSKINKYIEQFWSINSNNEILKKENNNKINIIKENEKKFKELNEMNIKLKEEIKNKNILIKETSEQKNLAENQIVELKKNINSKNNEIQIIKEKLNKLTKNNEEKISN